MASPEPRQASEDQSTSLQMLEKLLGARQELMADITRLQAQREKVGRFLDIDREVVELATLAEKKQELIESAQVEASNILEGARADAERIRSGAAQSAAASYADAVTKAKREADEILREANQAAAAQRQSAEAVYNEARRKTANVDENLSGRLASCETREALIRDKVMQLNDREKAIGRLESAVDGKRAILRAGIEALRRVLDELDV